MSAFSLGELKLRMSMKNFFTHHFLQKQITAFPDPSACAACLAFAIRKPDPQAVRMLLAFGISANGHPFGSPGNQFAIKDDLSEIRPLGLSIKMMKLVGDEYPDLFRLHAQVAFLLIEADARLNAQCPAIFMELIMLKVNAVSSLHEYAGCILKEPVVINPRI